MSTIKWFLLNVHYLIKLNGINHQLDIIFLFQYYSYINCAIYRNVEIIKIFNLDWKIIAILYVNGISSPNLYVEYRSARSFAVTFHLTTHDVTSIFNGVARLPRDETRSEDGKREGGGRDEIGEISSVWFQWMMKYVHEVPCKNIVRVNIRFVASDALRFWILHRKRG